MIVLCVHLHVRAGLGTSLEGSYRDSFTPAIRVQAGFRGSSLLRAHGHDGKYLITIMFETEEARLAWVATAEHQAAWPRIEALCTEVADEGFDFIAEAGRSTL